jgi:hypothetical protein
MDVESVYAMFEGLQAALEPQQKQLRFVLALLLWRRRVLKLTDTQYQDDREVWHFTAPARDAVHLVDRPPLSENEIDQLSAQLEALISGQESPAGEPVQPGAAASAEQGVRNA